MYPGYNVSWRNFQCSSGFVGLFIENLLMSAKGHPSFFWTFPNKMVSEKFQRVPPLRFFGTIKLFKILAFRFFLRKSFNFSQGFLFIFLIFCGRMDVEKIKGPLPQFLVL